MVDAATAQFVAHDAREGADGGFGDIGDPEKLGMDLVACAHAADEGDALRGAFYGDQDLG